MTCCGAPVKLAPLIDRTGNSCEKSAVVSPREKLDVPSVLLEPNGLSAFDSAVERCASNSSLRSLVARHWALKPSDLFWVLVAKSAPPIAMSLFPAGRNSVYTSGAATGPLVHDDADAPKLNQAETSLRFVCSLFSEYV